MKKEKEDPLMLLMSAIERLAIAVETQNEMIAETAKSLNPSPEPKQGLRVVTDEEPLGYLELTGADALRDAVDVLTKAGVGFKVLTAPAIESSRRT